MLIKSPSLAFCLIHLELSKQKKEIKTCTQILTKPIYFLKILEKDPLLIGYATDKYRKLFPLANPHKEFQIPSLDMIFTASDQSQKLSHLSYALADDCDLGHQSGSCNKPLIKIELNCFKIHVSPFVSDFKWAFWLKQSN